MEKDTSVPMSTMTVTCIDIVCTPTTTLLMLLFISIERALMWKGIDNHLLDECYHFLILLLTGNAEAISLLSVRYPFLLS